MAFASDYFPSRTKIRKIIRKMKSKIIFLLFLFCLTISNAYISNDEECKFGKLIEEDELYILDLINKIYINSDDCIFIESPFIGDFRKISREGYKSFQVTRTNIVYNQYEDWVDLFYSYYSRTPGIIRTKLFSTIINLLIKKKFIKQPIYDFLADELIIAMNSYSNHLNDKDKVDIMGIMNYNHGYLTLIKNKKNLIPFTISFDSNYDFRINYLNIKSFYKQLNIICKNVYLRNTSLIMRKIYDYISLFPLSDSSQLWFYYRLKTFSNDNYITNDFFYFDTILCNDRKYIEKCWKFFSIKKKSKYRFVYKINGKFILIYLVDNKLFYAKSNKSAKYIYDLYLHIKNKKLPSDLLQLANNIKISSTDFLWDAVMQIEYFEYGQISITPTISQFLRYMYNLEKNYADDSEYYVMFNNIDYITLSDDDLSIMYEFEDIIFYETKQYENPWFSEYYKLFYNTTNINLTH